MCVHESMCVCVYMEVCVCEREGFSEGGIQECRLFILRLAQCWGTNSTE